MTKSEQRQLLRAICNNVRDAPLRQSEDWPVDWDGHELRELTAYAFTRERTSLMQERTSSGRHRRLAARNEIICRRLY